MRARLYPKRMSEEKIWQALLDRLLILSDPTAIGRYDYHTRAAFAAEALDCARELRLRGHQLTLGG